MSALAATLAACSASDEGSGGDAPAGDASSADGAAGSDATVLFEDTATAGDAAGDDDAGTLPVGSSCTTPASCSSGWCVPSASGPVCAGICVDTCPAGTQCVPATGESTDPVYLCVPSVVPPGADTIGGDGGGDAVADAGGDATGEPVGDAVSVDGGPSDDATAPLDDATSPADDSGVSDTDQDGDGIPDSEDNLPCLAIYLVVYNQGVTSASIQLNGAEVVPPNSFPTTDAVIVWLNPTTGTNTLDLAGKLGGSPSDAMSIAIMDTAGNLYFATVIVREAGPPKSYTFTFDVDVTCP
ncbi:MAG: hypothetical protein U1F43_05070 [Myxococcota bacterium]